MAFISTPSNGTSRLLSGTACSGTTCLLLVHHPMVPPDFYQARHPAVPHAFSRHTIQWYLLTSIRLCIHWYFTPFISTPSNGTSRLLLGIQWYLTFFSNTPCIQWYLTPCIWDYIQWYLTPCIWDCIQWYLTPSISTQSSGTSMVGLWVCGLECVCICLFIFSSPPPTFPSRYSPPPTPQPKMGTSLSALA